MAGRIYIFKFREEIYFSIAERPLVVQGLLFIQATGTQSTFSHSIYSGFLWMLTFYLRLALTSKYFPSGSTIKNLYVVTILSRLKYFPLNLISSN